MALLLADVMRDNLCNNKYNLLALVIFLVFQEVRKIGCYEHESKLHVCPSNDVLSNRYLVYQLANFRTKYFFQQIVNLLNIYKFAEYK